MKFNGKTKYVLTIIIFIIFITNIFYWFEYYENTEMAIQKRTLKKDGFIVIGGGGGGGGGDNIADNERIMYPLGGKGVYEFPPPKITENVMGHLPEGYVFMDYVYKINDVSLSTFHRDVTSSKNVHGTKYPTYTLILYKYGGELLSVCPESHNTYPFVWSNIVNIEGKNGTYFLFDCDLLHCGQLNHCKKRTVIQYKICHKDDIPKLLHLQGIRKTKTETCRNDVGPFLMRKLSYYFEFPINYIFTPLLIKREENNIIGYIQSFIPVSFYNNY